MLRTKRPRCAPCTKAKRKCTPSEDSTSCEACVKRGIECELDSVKIISYNGPRHQEKPARPPPKPKTVTVTTSSLIGMLTDAADHERHADEFLLALNPKVYLPRQKRLMADDSETPLIIDETEEHFFDDEITIPQNFSLNDFVHSSLRVRSIKQQQQVLKAMSFSTTSKGEQEIGQELQKNGFTVEMHSSTTSRHKKPQFASFKDVNITIDTNNLSKDYYVKEHGAQLSKGHQVTIVNFNESLIPRHIGERLFTRFCETQSRPPQGEGNKDKVSALQICLPLVFGNVTVLEAAIVLSYYHTHDQDMMGLQPSIDLLHLSILSELQVRLHHPSTLCCDHTILLLLYLLQIEVLKGASIPLFQHLLSICHSLVTFRGGPKKFVETLTGQCLMELLSPLFINGNHHIHEISVSRDTEDPLMTWNSFQSYLNTTLSLNMYDNILYTPKCGFGELRELIKAYGHINHLQNLLTVAYSANSELDNDGSKVFNGFYDGLAGEHLGEILNESVMVDGSIRRVLGIEEAKTLEELQRRFCLESSLLYLYQTVYHDVALNSRSVLLVKRLLELCCVIFDLLGQLSGDQLKQLKVYPLAMFTLGVSLIGHTNRDWYVSKLEELYHKTQKQNLATMIAFLRKVWELNPIGNTYVDTRQLAAQHGITICLHV